MARNKKKQMNVPFYPPFRNASGVVLHTCAICKRVDAWKAGWRWYGSYREMEDGVPILVTCSEPCWNDAISLQYVPLNAECLDSEAA